MENVSGANPCFQNSSLQKISKKVYITIVNEQHKYTLTFTLLRTIVVCGKERRTYHENESGGLQGLWQAHDH
jgi:hypothetical protein